MTTVWIYVDTNKEVGDRNHLKVFATALNPHQEQIPFVPFESETVSSRIED